MHFCTVNFFWTAGLLLGKPWRCGDKNDFAVTSCNAAGRPDTIWKREMEGSSMLIPMAPTDRQLAAHAGDDHTPVASGPDASSVSSAASRSGARVIEFYVPATFQLPARHWIPPEARGKLIEFPGRGVRKSASCVHDIGIVDASCP